MASDFFMTLKTGADGELQPVELFGRLEDGSYGIVPVEEPEIEDWVKRKTLMFNIEAMHFDGTEACAGWIGIWADQDWSWIDGEFYLRVTDDNDTTVPVGYWVVKGYDSEWPISLMSDAEYQTLGEGLDKKGDVG